LVTTNATTLNFEKQAQKFLPYIDQLILSVEAIDRELQQVISRTKVFVEWDKVFENIEKHWKGNMLKANIVITQDNLPELFNIVKFLQEK
jgi:wyosine [tRNA(Phe)-imidazoG37] synthetase (radical SAM superfamily)